MPGERHPQELLKRLWRGGVIRDLMEAKAERLILAFSFGDASLRALHQARLCISSCFLYRKQYRIATTTTATADAVPGERHPRYASNRLVFTDSPCPFSVKTDRIAVFALLHLTVVLHCDAHVLAHSKNPLCIRFTQDSTRVFRAIL